MKRKWLVLMFCLLFLMIGCGEETAIKYIIEPVKVGNACRPNSEIYWVIKHVDGWGSTTSLKTFYTLDEAITFKKECDRSMVASGRIPEK